MSEAPVDLQVALVAEGDTDVVVIKAALRALLQAPFTLNVLPPEPTRAGFGGGWSGVFKWCREVAREGVASLDKNPTFAAFDLVVIHVDADVAEGKYAQCGSAVEEDAKTLPPLPCSQPCPPAEAGANEIRSRIQAWLGTTSLGPKAILCVPSKSSEAWLSAAVLDDNHPLLRNLECNLNLAAQLAALPLATRIKKTKKGFQAHEQALVSGWARVRQRCTQAERFSADVEQAFGG